MSAPSSNYREDPDPRFRRAAQDFIIEAILFTRQIVRSQREYDRLDGIVRLFEERYEYEFGEPPRNLNWHDDRERDAWREDIDAHEARHMVRHFMPPFGGDEHIRYRNNNEY